VAKKNLFDPIVDESKLHPSFVNIQLNKGSICCREMLNSIYEDFIDPDGNFLEQFQTTGFDARFFELYLFAYFSRSGFELNREYEKPDFLVTRNGLTVAVEATTVNPPTSGVLFEHGSTISDLDEAGLAKYLSEEIPMRFGSPLLSKLRKKYWEDDHCKGLALVIAIEAFHDENSLSVPDGALMNYLFGTRSTAKWNEFVNLMIDNEKIEEHRVGEKQIPSEFFAQPDVEYVSAIIFSNSGTSAKFSRMGFQHGFGNDEVSIYRRGQCYTPLESAMDPSSFAYSLDCPPFVESWGQGLTVIHNPNALHPIPHDFFHFAIQAYLHGDDVAVDYDAFAPWHPYVSKTMTLYVGSEAKEVLRNFPPENAILVAPIDKEEFDRFVPGECLIPDSEEQGWYGDSTLSFLGTVLHLKTENVWAAYFFARNENFKFVCIGEPEKFSNRGKARSHVQEQIEALLVHSPRRIFSPKYKDQPEDE
jgi:hypothetical protein